MKKIVFLLTLCFVVNLFGVTPPVGERWIHRLGSEINRWDEAIPLGNGTMGALVWGKGNVLNISLDRCDLWEEKLPKEFSEPDFSYENLQKLVQEKNQKEISRKYNKPYHQASPTKLPGTRLVVTFPEQLKITAFDFHLYNGSAFVSFQDAGGDHKKSIIYFDPDADVLIVTLPEPIKDVSLSANKGVKSLGYQDAKITKNAQTIVLEQPRPDAESYTIAAAWSDRFMTVSFAEKESLKLCETVLKTEDEVIKIQQRSEAYWKDFWSKSRVNIPDPLAQKWYDLAIFFYGAGGRKVPMALQGVWTQDDGGLPPWKGDFHSNLNMQINYWPVLISGHEEESKVFIRFFNGLVPGHQKFAKSFYNLKEGIVLPGAMSVRGNYLGGWVQYMATPSSGMWIFQNYHWHWLYTQDKDYLKKEIYPYGQELAKGVEGLLKKDETGHWIIPLSSSAEIFDDSLRAWLVPNSNYDEAILQWFFTAMTDLAMVVGDQDGIKHYGEYARHFGDYHVDKNGYMFSKNETVAESHRVPSHIMQIYPLACLDVEQGGDTRRLIEHSLNHMYKLGTSQWTGYTFSWASAMEARAGRTDTALHYMNIYCKAFVAKNGFHLNGDQVGGYSRLRYRPFTLEGNFGHAQAVHEMLLQTWGGVIRLFPATPSSWTDASFELLRGEGGHKISAVRENKQLKSVEITANLDGKISVRKDPAMLTPNWKWSLSPVSQTDKDFVFMLKKGQTLTGSSGK